MACPRTLTSVPTGFVGGRPPAGPGRPSPMLMPPQRTAVPAPRRHRRPARPGWQVTGHARGRAAELGFTVEELLTAAAQPELSYVQPRLGAGQAVHIRGDVVVAVDSDTTTVLTVLLRRDDRWEHGVHRRAG